MRRIAMAAALLGAICVWRSAQANDEAPMRTADLQQPVTQVTPDQSSQSTEVQPVGWRHHYRHHGYGGYGGYGYYGSGLYGRGIGITVGYPYSGYGGYGGHGWGYPYGGYYGYGGYSPSYYYGGYYPYYGHHGHHGWGMGFY